MGKIRDFDERVIGIMRSKIGVDHIFGFLWSERITQVIFVGTADTDFYLSGVVTDGFKHERATVM